jgi:hypothetical protein
MAAVENDTDAHQVPSSSDHHKAKRTRKSPSHAQPPSAQEQAEQLEHEAHLESVFGAAPAAKPLNVAAMFQKGQLSAGLEVRVFAAGLF